MKQLIDINVSYNKTILNSFSYLVESNDVNTDEVTLNGSIAYHKCPQISLCSDFCQTLCFIRKLNSCLDYRRIVFNNLKLFATKSVGRRVSALTQEVCCSDDIDDQTHEAYHIISVGIKLKSLDYLLAIDKHWFV